MNVELLTVSSQISALIGVIAPFVLPFMFKWVEKITKKALGREDKRLIITVLSIAISFIIICASFNWVGTVEEIIKNFVLEFSKNFLIIKGVVQTVYELIIKGVVIDDVAVIDETLTKLAK